MRYIVLIICFIAISLVVSFAIPTAVDWYGAFRPATLAVLSGQSPFGWGFFSPPWALIILSPFALMPPPFDRGLFFVASLLAFAYAAYRLGAGPLTMGLFLLSAPVVTCLYDGQLEGLVLLGAVLPPALGLFLVSLKPQAGIGLIAYWLIVTWRTGGLRQVVLTFVPVSVALLLSLFLYGPWPLLTLDTLSLGWNYSLFPWLIPAGLALLIFAIRRSDLKPALASGPCFAPYLGLHSWSVFFPWLFSLRSSRGLAPVYTGVAVVASWAVWLINTLS